MDLTGLPKDPTRQQIIRLALFAAAEKAESVTELLMVAQNAQLLGDGSDWGYPRPGPAPREP